MLNKLLTSCLCMLGLLLGTCPVMATSNPPAQSLWTVIRQGYQLDHYTNEPMVRHYLYYYRHNPQLVYAIASQARPFLYLVVQQIKQQHLPTELALIPIIESAFHSDATSSAGAVGIWQLMPATASQYNVSVGTFWYNGRQSIMQSTSAALAYLNYLHNYFDGNWLLALAAYNAGEGTVKYAIHYNLERNLPTDFWHLSLPQQTEDYVPKILALATIIGYPWRYAIRLPAVPNHPIVASVLLPRQISLVEAADYADMSLNQLRELNPAYTQLATPPTTSGTYYLVLPIAHVTTFEQNLAASTKATQYYWRRYTVRSGDSLSLIAQLTGTSIVDLVKYNHLTNNTIYPGENLIYPTTSKAHHYHVYTVRPGDNLSKIAQHYGVSVEKLEKWNHLHENSILHIGQRLIVY